MSNEESQQNRSYDVRHYETTFISCSEWALPTTISPVHNLRVPLELLSRNTHVSETHYNVIHAISIRVDSSISHQERSRLHLSKSAKMHLNTLWVNCTSTRERRTPAKFLLWMHNVLKANINNGDIRLSCTKDTSNKTCSLTKSRQHFSVSLDAVAARNHLWAYILPYCI